MTKFKLIVCGIVSALFLHGCNEILEPVAIFNVKKGVESESIQEDFEINIKSLTFESARKANNDPYPRMLMVSGSGSKAKLSDEAEFLISDTPLISEKMDYLLGIGDKLLFSQLNEFVTPATQFPSGEINTDYLLGVGDQLTLIQLNEVASGISTIISSIPKDDDVYTKSTGKTQPNESILKSSGLVGTDGNILLLGLGSIKAVNKSLNDIQTEVRNILIRNGLAPSFQLEITGFNSKKAFVTFPNLEKTFGYNEVSITNLPITLKELAINYGLQPSSEDSTIITLTRSGQKFRMTARQIFEKLSPPIVIKNRDQIEIDEIQESFTSIETFVGSRGNILISGIGSFKAENRSLAEVHADIIRVLMEKGLVPNFQLEITDYKSKKFYLVTKNLSSKKIALTNSKLELKEAVLSNTLIKDSDYLKNANGSLTIIELIRKNLSYRITLQDLMSRNASKTLVQDGDTILLKNYDYKPGQVFAFGGAGNAQMVTINPSKRETLADILFTNKGALNNLLARRSEVYLLRGQNPSVAYHLDAQNVSRILVAAKTELRPNDIVYVADRPIISFSRTLSELLPLRILLRDIQNNNIP